MPRKQVRRGCRRAHVAIAVDGKEDGPKELRNIRLTEVSLVRRGANQAAKTVLIKSGDDTSALPTSFGQRVRAAGAAILRALRKDEQAPPQTTAEILAAEQRWQAYCQLRYAFMDSVRAIWDSNVPNRRELMVKTGVEFLNGLLALMPDPPAPASTEGAADVAAVAKELLLPEAENLFASPDATDDQQSAHILKELRAIEDALNLPAPAAENGEAMSLFKKEDKKPQDAQITTTTDAPPEVATLKKALEDKDAETVTLKKALADAETRAAAAEADAKKATGSVEQLRKEFEDGKRAALRKDLATEVASYAHDGLSADEAVDALTAPTPDHVRKLLKAATVKDGKMTGLMKAAGVRGAETPGAEGGTVAKVEAATVELRKANPALTLHQARAAVLKKMSAEEVAAFNEEKSSAAGLAN